MVNVGITVANGVSSAFLLLQATRLWNESSDVKKPRLTDWIALLGGSVLLGNTIYLASGNPQLFQVALLPLAGYAVGYVKYNQFWPRVIPWIRRNKREGKEGER